MHSSAYIKPFEEEMKEWEEKLISMQDILDAWLRCQESWLYLEPIFNSEDIMKQMPVEGRKFNKVIGKKRKLSQIGKSMFIYFYLSKRSIGFGATSWPRLSRIPTFSRPRPSPTCSSISTRPTNSWTQS